MTYMKQETLFSVAQQTFDDPSLGAKMEFYVKAGSPEPFRLRVTFEGSNEVREYRFDANGLKSGSGTLIVDELKTSPRLRVV